MITGRGYTLLPLQGEVFPVVLGYPGCRFALPWAKRSLGFQPVALDGPIVPDFFTSNWTPYLYVAKIHIFAEKTNDALFIFSR